MLIDFPMLFAAAAFLLSFLTGWPVYRILDRRGIVDRPNARSSHTRPTARGGGVTIVLSILVVGGVAGFGLESALVLLTMLGCAAVLAVVSFVDDLRSLRASVRFGCHGMAAMGLLGVLVWPHLEQGWSTEPTDRFLVLAMVAVGFLWVTGYSNAFNFMDGINGIAAGQACVTGAGMGLLGGLALGTYASAPVMLSLIVGGAALGFIPHNFPRARMFMGDVGSVPLGFVLSGLALWLASTAGWWLLAPLVLLHANFVLDTGITLVRRVLRGERWHEAHREHFYQRLVRSGKSHAFVTGWEMALQCVVLGMMVLYLYVGTFWRVALIAGVVIMWLVFFVYCERLFRRSLASSAGITSVELQQRALAYTVNPPRLNQTPGKAYGRLPD